MPATERVLEFPGFTDAHVHFRDPGVPEAETTESGLEAARRGGFAAVVTMPNTTPPVDTPEMVHRGSRLGMPRLLASACITRGRQGSAVADLEELAAAGAVFFTDDGSYVRDTRVMEEAMRRTAALGLVVSQHALAPGLTEADCIRRDLSLCRETGCRLHVQHLSTAAGVSLVRAARREGLPVTAEATPHHLLLTRDDIPLEDAALQPQTSNLRTSFFKMAPPLATKEDRAALREAVKDGLFMFATDHAPHPPSAKACAYEKAANGIIGLETAIPITYAVMVEEEGMSVEKWAEAWWKLPREILPVGSVPAGSKTRVSIGAPRRVDVSSFASLSRNCPYGGMYFACWAIPADPMLPESQAGLT